MPMDEFWHGEADLIYAYRVAYMRKQELLLEQANQKAWLEGMYNLRALWEVHSHINLETKDQHKAIHYFEKPIDLFGRKQDEVETREQKIARLRKQEEDKIKVMVAQAQMALNKKNNKRE